MHRSTTQQHRRRLMPSRAAAVAAALAAAVAALLVAAAATPGGKLVWHASRSVAVYSDVAIDPASKTSFAANWLKAPFEIEAFDEQGSGTPRWIYQADPKAPSWEEAQIAIAASKAPGLAVNAFVVVYDGNGNYTMSLHGLSSKTGTAVWQSGLAKVATDLVDLPLVAMTADGSLAAIVAFSNISFKSPPSTVIYVLHAQTGKVAFAYTVPLAPGEQPSALELMFTDDGKYLMFMDFGHVFVLDVAKQALRAPAIPLTASGAARSAAICPMGGYVAVGFETVDVYGWDDQKSVYALQTTASMPNAFVQSLKIENEMLAIGWSRLDTKQFWVELLSMPDAKSLWLYTSAASNGSLQVNPTQTAMDGDFIAVANWGSESPATPQVLVFHKSSSTPLLAYVTPGSMMAIDVSALSATEAFVTAAGKHVHANVMGSGGDVFGFVVSSV